MYRRRSLHYADVEGVQRLGSYGRCPGCGYVSWFCDWIFPYIHGNSGNFIWYFNTTWSVVRELEDYGKGESGHQCRQIQAFGVSAFY